MTVSDEFHGISTEDPDIFHAQVSDGSLKEPGGPAVNFDQVDPRGSARCKLKTHAPGSGKQVKHCKPVKIIDVRKDIEQTLTGEVGGWPGPEGGGHRYMPPYDPGISGKISRS